MLHSTAFLVIATTFQPIPSSYSLSFIYPPRNPTPTYTSSRCTSHAVAVAMPSREENEYSRRGTVREGEESNRSNRSTREPIDHPEMLEVPADTPAAVAEEPKENIDDVVNNLIIHEDRPIENLPTMSAPELKLIGRCVSLSTRQTINDMTSVYYYTGLVAAVTAAAVTLMHVNRYTEADFKIFKAREKAVLQAANATAEEMTKRHGFSAETNPPNPHVRSPSSEMDQDQGHLPMQTERYVAPSAGGVGREAELTSLRVDAAGSLAPAVTMPLKKEGGEAKAFAGAAEGEVDDGSSYAEESNGATPRRRPSNFRAVNGSAGPLPFVSFLRKSIHDVKFGRDPRSSFYSLLQDPARELMDMQYLRMFVRRYLVHTSEGNNPRQVPMYAFVTVRGACPHLDHELANRLVREELPGLMKADRAIEKDKKRNRNREVRRTLEIQEYRAPPGLFSNTGILYLTNTPQSTFLSGVITVFFTIIFAVFLAVTLAVIADALIVSFLSQIISYLIASLVVWIMAGVAIGLHAVNMHIPLSDDRQLIVARALLTLGAVACSVMTLVKLLGRLSNSNIYGFMALRSNSLTCDFYDRYRCSGFTSACLQGSYYDVNLCGGCPNANLYSNICYHSLWSQLQIIVIPLLVFCVFVLLAQIHSMFQFVKLWLMARALSARIPS